MITFGRLVTGFADAFVWRSAISIDALSLAEGLAHIRRIGRTITLVAGASFRCTAKAVDAFLAAGGIADA